MEHLLFVFQSKNEMERSMLILYFRFAFSKKELAEIFDRSDGEISQVISLFLESVDDDTEEMLRYNRPIGRDEKYTAQWLLYCHLYTQNEDKMLSETLPLKYIRPHLMFEGITDNEVILRKLMQRLVTNLNIPQHCAEHEGWTFFLGSWDPEHPTPPGQAPVSAAEVEQQFNTFVKETTETPLSPELKEQLRGIPHRSSWVPNWVHRLGYKIRIWWFT